MIHSNTIITHATAVLRRPSARRGNAMVLIAGLLVLLVILATAFITRTQSSRSGAIAQQRLNGRQSSVDAIARTLAAEVSGALFVRPIAGLGPGSTPSASTNRVLAEVTDNASFDQVISPFGVDQSIPYNFAPYSVVPWTNWPDQRGDSAIGGVWPDGPGVTIPNASIQNEGNPLGSPGMGDSRWLSDLEPVRWTPPGALVVGMPTSFKFWRHMTNLSRPNNGLRIIRNLQDVMGTDPTVAGGVMTNLDVPVEQWLTDVQPPDTRYRPDGSAQLVDILGNNFLGQYSNWLNNNAASYAVSYFQPNTIPHNFIELKSLNNDQRISVERILADADGDGFTDSFWHSFPGASASGTRQVVAVRIVDNSAMLNTNVATQFSPGAGSGSSDTDTNDYHTTGETPADLALVGEGMTPSFSDFSPSSSWNTGFFDRMTGRERIHQAAHDLPNLYWNPSDGPTYHVNYNADDKWGDYLNELGFILPSGYSRAEDGNLAWRNDRMLYWRHAASRPFDASRNYSPFDLGDEIELRMTFGQNQPWVFSRFEQAVNPSGGDDGSGQTDREWSFVRSYSEGFRETSEILDQLTNRELFFDHRHRLTLYSGARNETMPPWLWWRWPTAPGNPAVPMSIRLASSAFPGEPVINRFLLQQRLKLDLREANPLLAVDNHAANPDPNAGFFRLDERLPHALLNALSDGTATGRPQSNFDVDVHGRPPNSVPAIDAHSYFGDYITGSSTIEELRHLAASFTANLLSIRDYDYEQFELNSNDWLRFENPAPLYDELGRDHGSGIVESRTGQRGAIPLPGWGIGVPEDGTTRYLGMEIQPFLVEAFIAHVHDSETVPAPGPPPSLFAPYYGGAEGWNYVDDLHEKVTIIAVQIANPFDRAIPVAELGRYGIRVFDHTIWLDEIVGLEALPPATEKDPFTATFYLIPEVFAGTADFRARWLDFLDLELREASGVHNMHPDYGVDERSMFYNLADPANSFVDLWSNDPDDYDTPLGDGAGGPGSTPGGPDLEAHHNAIELVRRDYSHPDPAILLTEVVIDRFDYDEDHDDHNEFFNRIRTDLVPPPDRHRQQLPAAGNAFSEWNGIRLETGDRLARWARVSRAWGADWNYVDTDLATIGIQPDERAPRFIMADQIVTVGASLELESETNEAPGNLADTRGDSFFIGNAPDEDIPVDPLIQNAWFTRTFKDSYDQTVLRKPTFFDGHRVADGTWPVDGKFNFPDRGFYQGTGSTFIAGYRNSLQMLQRDADFTTIGDIYNVWMWGHELKFVSTDPLALYDYTERTFSEFMLVKESTPAGDGIRLNRLDLGEMVGTLVDGSTNDFDPNHRVPAQPAGLRVMDLFVCDGPGFNFDPTNADFPNAHFVSDLQRPGNAMGYSGKLTPGLININTAPPEVMQALPFWYKLVAFNARLTSDPAADYPRYPRSMLPEAVLSFRDRMLSPFTGAPTDLVDRDDDLHPERGMASVSEVRLLDEAGDDYSAPGLAATDYHFRAQSWTAAFAATSPFRAWVDVGEVIVDWYGAHLSTEFAGVGRSATRVHEADYVAEDDVAADLEEQNMLLSGASNILSVRSDVFTVYFKVRTFKQDLVTGRWDASNPENIVDESRYVMLVDRSNVNRPGDAPRILYLEKVPE